MKKIYILFLFWNLLGNSQVIDSVSITCDTIKHEYYTNYYSFENKNPLYIDYNLYPNYYKYTKNNYQSFFVSDKNYLKLKNISKYYKNSGYDRGHLFPAEDGEFNINAFYDTYLITNMVPQLPEFNRGIWKKLELKIRKQSKKDSLQIITGCDLHNELLFKIGEISIPNYFFKIIINFNKETFDIYYIPNKKSNLSLNNYLIKIDEFEEKTGIYINNKYEKWN